MISIAIINYKTLQITLNTIKSVIQMTPNTDYELIVIDNASGAEEAKALKEACDKLHDELMNKSGKGLTQEIKVLLNDVNLGFGKANNQAMKMAKGSYVALLNSDTELTTDSFTKAMVYLENCPEVGAVGCRLATPDGKLDHGCRRGFPTPKASLFYFLKVHKWLKRPELDLYKLGHLDEHQINEVDVISGAFMVLPKRVIDEVGMLDERFFMYGEDIDWCYRIKEAGFKIVYNPELGDVIHYKGASGKKRKFKTLYNFYEAMFLFYNKHYLKKYNFLVTICVYLGIFMQFVVKLILNYLRKTK